jgi:aldehyde:ferredoxin oxidoreductase
MVTTFGYTGKILRVDLSSGSTIDTPTMDYAERFLGGRGIAAKIYWDEVSPDVKAFDPENRLIFMTGPLAGLADLAGSRWQIYGKSPTTTPEHFCYSNLGGNWGAYLKFAGYDGIVIREKSDKPVYLFLHEGIAEIRDASFLWGKGSVETRDILKGELGSTTGVAASGPAGDNMVTFASLLADNDASGSSGFGAVMGSKKLKAIAVRGDKEPIVANPERLYELTEYIRELKKGTAKKPQQSAASPKLIQEICYGCMTGGIRVV